MEATAEAATIAAPERCMMLPVQNAGKHAKYPSNPMAQGQYIAAIATRSIDRLGRPEDTN